MSLRERATILVVEENAAVQELIDQVLGEFGHRVLSTNDPFEAIEVASRVEIDVVVSGVLAEVRTLVCQLRSIQPDVHIIVCDPGDEHETIDRTTTLSAPLSLSDLREAVSASLDRRSTTID
jgi:CheY-like chemotaxis protein